MQRYLSLTAVVVMHMLREMSRCLACAKELVPEYGFIPAHCGDQQSIGVAKRSAVCPHACRIFARQVLQGYSRVLWENFSNSFACQSNVVSSLSVRSTILLRDTCDICQANTPSSSPTHPAGLCNVATAELVGIQDQQGLPAKTVAPLPWRMGV